MPIVEGTGAMGGGGFSATSAVEDAMIKAIKDAQAEGITDSEVIRERIRYAIDGVQQAQHEAEAVDIERQRLEREPPIVVSGDVQLSSGTSDDV